jgi:histidine triad (HIT) family protein
MLQFPKLFAIIIYGDRMRKRIMNCIFCKIINDEIPSRKVYEDEDILAFHDVNPQAPVHVLVIPKKHIAKVSDMDGEDELLLGKLVNVSKKVADDLGILEDGFRLVINNGKQAHQTVFHIHLHVIGGRRMGWPPG